MKSIRTAFVVAFCLALAPAASARDTFHDLAVERAAQSSLGREKLHDVPFYMIGQSHPPVSKTLGTFTSNMRTNAFGRSDEKACRIAFLSAVISLQERVRKEGGDAVIDVRSITKHNDLDSPTEYRCVAGVFIANVALRGTVVKLEK